MKKKVTERVVMVCDSDPAAFQDLFNSKMEALSEYEPTAGEIQCGPSGFWTAIRYSICEIVSETVADEFAMEGIRYTCGQCPLHAEIKDKRIKHCACKYHELGRTNLNYAACELFYKKLKQGTIEIVEGC